MEKMSEAYNEIFLKTDARSIIPAVRYLIEMCILRDEATAFLDEIKEKEYPVYIAGELVPNVVIQMAEDLQAACYAEVYSAENRVRLAIKAGLESTWRKQEELLGIDIRMNSHEMSDLIHEIEIIDYLGFDEATDEDVLAELLDIMSKTNWDIRPYDADYEKIPEPDLSILDDNVLPTKADIITLITATEDYLTHLKDELAEFEKEESKNIDEHAEDEEK